MVFWELVVAEVVWTVVIEVVAETATAGAFTSRLGELGFTVNGFTTKMMPANATIPTSKMRERRVNLFFMCEFTPFYSTQCRQLYYDFSEKYPKSIANPAFGLGRDKSPEQQFILSSLLIRSDN